jgi:hypothetical protein
MHALKHPAYAQHYQRNKKPSPAQVTSSPPPAKVMSLPPRARMTSGPSVPQMERPGACHVVALGADDCRVDRVAEDHLVGRRWVPRVPARVGRSGGRRAKAATAITASVPTSFLLFMMVPLLGGGLLVDGYDPGPAMQVITCRKWPSHP